MDDPKRGFGSPADLDPSIYFVCVRLENDDVEFWEPNPRTPKRGFGSPADLDPSIYFVCDCLENDDVEFWEPNPRTPKRGFGSLADLDPDSQNIVEDLFRQVHLWLTVTDRLFLVKQLRDGVAASVNSGERCI